MPGHSACTAPDDPHALWLPHITAVMPLQADFAGGLASGNMPACAATHQLLPIAHVVHTYAPVNLAQRSDPFPYRGGKRTCDEADPAFGTQEQWGLHWQPGVYMRYHFGAILGATRELHVGTHDAGGREGPR